MFKMIESENGVKKCIFSYLILFFIMIFFLVFMVVLSVIAYLLTPGVKEDTIKDPGLPKKLTLKQKRL